MTESPEHIWANTEVWADGRPMCGEWNHADVQSPDDTEYVRRDIYDEVNYKIENAAQAMAETHDSWEDRCHAIMAALNFDFGGPSSI